ncbi:MAG TPA: molybdenum cofactor guanylyltransferase [Terriglobales bacterium]|nr:molybdenum cofactor guanylyltransferase [Terriglobales bacterium]
MKEDVTAFVLAGGKSTRMGREKAMLELGGRTLLERALKLASSVAAEAIIVGPRADLELYGRVVEDVYPGQGPLGGIHAALWTTPTEFNLILAVDTPFLESRFLKYLLEQAQESGAVVTLPRTADGFHPLAAVYRRAFRETAERALREGRNKIDVLFAEVETRILEAAELEKLAFAPAIFENLNTPEDVERAHGRSRGEQ